MNGVATPQYILAIDTLCAQGYPDVLLYGTVVHASAHPQGTLHCTWLLLIMFREYAMNHSLHATMAAPADDQHCLVTAWRLIHGLFSEAKHDWMLDRMLVCGTSGCLAVCKDACDVSLSPPAHSALRSDRPHSPCKAHPGTSKT